MAVVALEDLTFQFGARGWIPTRGHGDSSFVLGPLSLEFDSGVVCLVGPNGAGKSTLMNLIVGLLPATSGSVALDGGHGVGFVPQQYRLPLRASCREFLDYAAWTHRMPARSRPEAVEAALEAVGLSERADDRIARLSGGMVRRLGVAQAIVHRPGVVVLDEPSAGLDPLQRASLREVIPDLAEDRLVLVSTHLVEDVRGLHARVVVLNEGRAVFDGGVAELEALDDPDAPGDSALERAVSALMRSAV